MNNYEQKLLSLILNSPAAVTRCLELSIKSIIFENVEYGYLYNTVVSYFHKYKQIPTIDTYLRYLPMIVLDENIKKKLPILYVEIKDIKVEEPVDFIIDYLTKLWQTRAVKETVRQNMNRLSMDTIDTVSQELTASINKIQLVGTETGLEGDFRFAGDAVMERYQTAARGELIGVQYGFDGLDSRVGGHCAGELFIALGYMKVGKSTFLLNVANNVWQQNKNVVYFSAEVSKAVIDRRLTAMNIQAPITGIKQGNLDKNDYQKMEEFQRNAKKKKSSLYVVDQGGMSTDFISSKIRELKSKMNIDLVIVDYLGICKSNNMRSTQKEYEVIGQIAWELRDIAKIERLPILTAHQQNKERGISKSLDVGRHCDLMLSLDLKNEEAMLNNSELVELEATIMLTRDSAAGRFPIEAAYSKGIMKQPIQQTARLVDAVRDPNNPKVDEDLF